MTTLLSSTIRLLSRFMLPVVLVIFFIPFFALLFYSVPAADDFCKASLSFNTVPEHSVLTITWLYYTQWSPRWLTTLLQSFVMSRVNLVVTYGWLLLIIAVTNFASLWYFFRTVFSLPAVRSILVAAVFYAAWVASLGSPDQQIYWLTGAMEYDLSLSALLILASLLCKPRRTIWYSSAVALLSIAIPALHEIAGTFLCVMLLAGTIVMRMKKQTVWQWYVSLGATFISQTVVMLSPGNAVRASAEHRHLWDIVHLPSWVGHSFYHGLNSLSYPAVLVAACCIFLLSRPEESTHEATPPPTSLAVASLCAMFVLLCESAFLEVATSTWVPDRVFAWFEFVFWLLFVCVVLAGIPETFHTQFSQITKVGVYALLAVTLLGSTNFRKVVEDVRGPARAWHKINASRLSQHGGSLEFEALAQRPNFAKPQMLTSDPGCWVNMCLANYLGAESVIMNNSHDECPH